MNKSENSARNRKPKKALDDSIPCNVVDLIEYHPGSVISRTIEKNDGGTITLFSFDAGQELSEHSAPYNAYVQVVDGQAVLVIGGKEVIASAGEIVLMPANVLHAVYAKQRFKMILTMIKD